jgi:RimJ/RimL family protein N-acetyltransferase
MIIAANGLQIGLLCQATGLVPTPHVKGVAQVIDGVTTAVVGYDRWTENAVEMHIWIHRMTPAFVRAAFEYPFVQAGKGLVLGVTPGNNTAALALNERLGFKVVHVVKDGNAVGEDLVIQEMRKRDCKWVRRFN